MPKPNVCKKELKVKDILRTLLNKLNLNLNTLNEFDDSVVKYLGEIDFNIAVNETFTGEAYSGEANF